MSDAYRRVQKVEEPLPTNEVRVRRGQGLGRYLKRAVDLYNGSEGTSTPSVVLKGVSNAVQSVVNLAELIKHRVKGLHQINKISNITIVDEYEPLFEGLDHLKFSRVVTMLQVTLTKSPTKAELSDIGYQPPIDESEVQEYNERERVGGERRGGRGGRGQNRRGGRGGRGQRGGYRGGRGGAVDGAKPEGKPEGRTQYRDDGRNEGRNDQRPRGQGRQNTRGGNGDQDVDREGGNRNQRPRGQRYTQGEKPYGDNQGNREQNEGGYYRGSRGGQRNYNNNSQGDRPRRGGAEGGYNNEGGAGRGNRDPRPQTANDKPNRGVSRGGAPRGNQPNRGRTVTQTQP